MHCRRSKPGGTTCQSQALCLQGFWEPHLQLLWGTPWGAKRLPGPGRGGSCTTGITSVKSNQCKVIIWKKVNSCRTWKLSTRQAMVASKVWLRKSVVHHRIILWSNKHWSLRRFQGTVTKPYLHLDKKGILFPYQTILGVGANDVLVIRIESQSVEIWTRFVMIYPYLHPIQVAQPPRRRRPRQSHQASRWPWMINDSLRS